MIFVHGLKLLYFPVACVQKSPLPQENRIGRRDSSPDVFLREGRRLYTGLFFRRRWEKPQYLISFTVNSSLS